MSSKTRWPPLALSFWVLVLRFQSIRAELPACAREKIGGQVLSILGAMTQSETTHDNCKESCSAFDTVTLAGVTSGGICLCGEVDNPTPATLGSLFNMSIPSSMCDLPCPGNVSEVCGGNFGTFTLLNLSRAGEPITSLDFDISVEVHSVLRKISITNVSFGAESARAKVFFSTGLHWHKVTPFSQHESEFASDVEFTWSFGDFQISNPVLTVIIMNPEGLVTFARSKAFALDIPLVSQYLLCPVLANSSEPFHCAFAHSGRSLENATSLTVTDEDLAGNERNLTDLPPIGATYVDLGGDLTQGKQGIGNVSTQVIENIVLFDTFRDFTIEIVSVQWYGNGDNIDLAIYEQTCESGYDLNTFNGLCEAQMQNHLVNEVDQRIFSCEPTNHLELFMKTCTDPSSCPNQSGCQANSEEIVPKLTMVSGTKIPLVGSGSNYSSQFLEDKAMLLSPGQHLGVFEGQVAIGSMSDQIHFRNTEGNPSHPLLLAAVGMKLEFVVTEHQCMSNNTNVTITLELVRESESMGIKSNTTICQEPIRGFEVIFHTNTTLLDMEWIHEELMMDLNLSILGTGDIFNVSINTVAGMPILYSIDWKDGTSNSTFEDANGTRALALDHVFLGDGYHNVSVQAWNLHADPIHGSLGFIHNLTQDVWVLKRVMEWTQEGNLDVWERDSGPFDYQWTYPVEDSEGYPLLPTNPRLNCSLGSMHSTEKESLFELVSANFSTMEVFWNLRLWNISMEFPRAGEFEISCTLLNAISTQTQAHNITVLERIINFQAIPGYFPDGFDQNKDNPWMGFGPEERQFPLDRNVTFTFTMDQGTVEEIIFHEITDGQKKLDVFSVADKFNPTVFRVHLQFLEEGPYNLSILARNTLGGPEPYHLSLELVNRVRGLILSDGQIITNREEEKVFELDFQSLGSGYCIQLDFGDGTKASYGDQTYCHDWKPDAPYQADWNAAEPLEITHTYYFQGIFNVTATAKNLVTESPSSDSLSIVVTDQPCRPPKLVIIKSTQDNLNPVSYLMSEEVKISASIQTNCSDIIHTRKIWALKRITVDLETLEERSEADLDLAKLSPKTHNSSFLIIPPLSLEYGLYRLSLSARMWDEDDQDPVGTRKIPFQSGSFTFLDIRPSPLTAGLIQGQAGKVTRGKNQYLNVFPMEYSFDPDHPNDKMMNYHLFCRRLSPGNEEPSWDQVPGKEDLPVQGVMLVENGTKGGCFGGGPGQIANEGGSVIISTSQVISVGTFELLLTVQRGPTERIAQIAIDLEVSNQSVPVVEVSCANPAHCFSTEAQGSFVNPNHPLTLTSMCALYDGSDCSPPLTYQWHLLTQPSRGLVANGETFFKGGSQNPDVVIERTLFLDASEASGFRRGFIVQVEVTNSNGGTGKSEMAYTINRPPVTGTCQAGPDFTFAVIDELSASCADWTDPEDHLIAQYVVHSVSWLDGKKRTLKSFESLLEPGIFQMDVGMYNLSIDVLDQYGAISTYALDGTFTVEMPSSEILQEALQSAPSLTEVLASGNVDDLMAALKAQVSLLKNSDIVKEDLSWESLLPEEDLSTEEEKFEKALGQGEAKVNALNALISVPMEVLISDPNSAANVAQTISDLIGTPPEEGEAATVGIETTGLATNMISDIVDRMESLEFADSEQLSSIVESITGPIGTMLQTMSSSANEKNKDENDPCQGVSPIDRSAAKKGSVFEYETQITEIDLVISNNTENQECGAIAEAAQGQGAELGSKLTETLKKASLMLLKTMVEGEEKLIRNGPITISAKIIPGKDLSKFQMVGDDLTRDPKYKFPDNFCTKPLVNGTCSEPLGVAAVSYDTNPLCFVPTCDRLAPDTKVLDLFVTNRDRVPIDLSHVKDADGINGIQIHIPRTNSSTEILPEAMRVNVTSLANSRAIPKLSLEIDVDKADSGLVIEVAPLEMGSDNLTFLLAFEKIPTRKKYDFGALVQKLPWNTQGEYFEWFLNHSEVGNRTGKWYLTVLNLKEVANASFLTRRDPIDKAALVKFNSDFNLRIWTTGCYFYETRLKAWVADGMSIEQGFHNLTYCRSSHMTAFASGFFIRPILQDFAYNFAEAAFEDNLTVVMTILITLALFLGLMIWTRWRDIQDEKKLISRPLVDNDRRNKYLYEVIAFTGPLKEASCDSKVQMVITGDEGDTGIRTLDPGWRDTLRRGCVDSYIMRVDGSLGDLKFMRLWHNNAGDGNYASWFCTAIMVKDLQTGHHYEFLCHNWLAVERSDGQINRLLPTTGDGERQMFDFHFTQSMERGWRDWHLWLSIFYRNPFCRHTRSQRAMVGLAYIYLMMLLNIMWYMNTSEVAPQGLQMAQILISFEQIAIALVTALLATIPMILPIVLFKKSRRRVLRINHISLGFKGDRHPDEGDLAQSMHLAAKRNPVLLHWTLKYVAWMICVLIIVLALVLLLGWGVQMGQDRTRQWFSSSMFAVVFSVLAFDAMKVALGSLLLFVLPIKFDPLDDSQDLYEDEEADVVADSHLTHKDDHCLKREYEPYTENPLDEPFLERVRQIRKKEVEMWAVIHELFGYLIFIMVIYMISYGNRDPNSFRLQQHLRGSFMERPEFDRIVTSDDWWRWAHKSIVNELRAQAYYNGQAPYGLRGFIGDKVNRIMGYGILRQIRVQPNSCRVDQRIYNITRECAQASAFIYEDGRNYCNAWGEETGMTRDLPSCQGSAFKYTSAVDLNSLPYSAFMDLYGGGGYVYRINVPNKKVRADLIDLQQQHWINNHTRAVFLEFSVYNPNVNLFAIATMVAEFLPGGGIKPFTRFDIVRLLHHHEDTGTVLLILEVIFLLFIGYFLWEQVILMKQHKWAYFKSYWTLNEWSILILAGVATFFYVYRYILTQEILNTFKETYGNGYMKLQYVGVIDELYGYSIGMILFAATINFIKLLRFNNRFAMLLLTLGACWEDLSSFLLVFCLLFLAFVQVFYMILHASMAEFHSIVVALETCFTMVLNKFKFGSIRETSMTAAIMFFGFAISCSFIMINVMLTIIMEAYEETTQSLAKTGNKYDILDFLHRKTWEWIGFVPRPQPESALFKEIPQSNPNGPTDTFELRAHLDEVDNSGERHIEELPHKVDKFVNFINLTYFDGEMDSAQEKTLLNVDKDLPHSLPGTPNDNPKKQIYIG